MGSYVRSPLPLHRPLCPLRRVPFCCSRGHVYIFVRFVIDIPDLLFTLLSYFRIIRLSCDILGLICSGRYHPSPRYFSPRDEPRGVNERPAIARENEITFIVNILRPEVSASTGVPLYRRPKWRQRRRRRRRGFVLSGRSAAAMPDGERSRISRPSVILKVALQVSLRGR